MNDGSEPATEAPGGKELRDGEKARAAAWSKRRRRCDREAGVNSWGLAAALRGLNLIPIGI